MPPRIWSVPLQLLQRKRLEHGARKLALLTPWEVMEHTQIVDEPIRIGQASKTLHELQRSFLPRLLAVRPCNATQPLSVSLDSMESVSVQAGEPAAGVQNGQVADRRSSS